MKDKEPLQRSDDFEVSIYEDIVRIMLHYESYSVSMSTIKATSLRSINN